MTEKRFARWKHCPACKSYRYTWKPAVKYGRCQDCGHTEGDLVMDRLIEVSETGVVTVQSETGAIMRKIEGSGDPAAWMLDHPSIPRTPKEIHKPGCYICEDDEFARMGMSLCKPCPKCKTGHVAADDTICDDCGFDLYDLYEGDPVIDQAEIERRLGYHPATPETAPRFAAIRALFIEAARVVVEATPEGREQALALTAIQEAMMWANAAIACQGAPDPEPGKANEESARLQREAAELFKPGDLDRG